MTTCASRACLAFALLLGCQPTEYCADTCPLAVDGACDDGRSGAATGLCSVGTDCSDCGAYAPAAGNSPFTITNPAQPVQSQRSGGSSCNYPFAGCSEWTCGMDGRTLYHGREVAPGLACVGPGCGAVSWAQCPVIEQDRSLFWECRAGTQGVGCYFAGDPVRAGNGAVTHCYRAGECDDGTAIERCVRLPAFSQPSTDPSNVFNPAICATWIQVDDWRKDCGSCNDPCNLSISEGEQACAPEVLTPDAGPGPGPGPSPRCRGIVDEQIRNLRASLPPSSCYDSCITTFGSCLERTDCADVASCLSTAQGCISRCPP